MYHGIGDNPNRVYNTDFNIFSKQMKTLKNNGFIVESFRKFLSRKKSGNFPSRYVLLTFDDGYKSFIKAAEFLSELEFSGTFFITKNNCHDDQNSLSKNDILKLGEKMEIGSHTVSHPNLTKLDYNTLFYELNNSKKWLENLLGKEITSLSIPGGYINNYTSKIAKEVGYCIIGNSNEWYNNLNEFNNSQIINRVAIRCYYDLKTFKKIINGDFYFLIKRQIRKSGLILVKKLISHDRINKIRNKIYT